MKEQYTKEEVLVLLTNLSSSLGAKLDRSTSMVYGYDESGISYRSGYETGLSTARDDLLDVIMEVQNA